MTELNELELLPKTTLERWLIISTVMLVAIIEVLDMTIVNVALSPMMGTLGATTDQITWVLTSYIVSSAIFMLLTGFLMTRYGRKKLLLLNITGFLIASMLCGLSGNLTEIIIFRTMQGIFGAALVPLSQVILRSTYPKEDYGKAMAIWGMGIMVAPVLGPTIGGYITDHLTWRWVFYINLPICLLALAMALRFIKETPSRIVPVDWLGMTLMAVGVGALQIFLDRGSSADWFQSTSIQYTFVLMIVTLSLFLYRGLKIKDKNIINLYLFTHRNFALSCLLLVGYSIAIMGIISIEPILLEHFMGFTTEDAGLVMAPMGIASATGMLLVGNIIKRIDPRHIMLVGIIITIAGTHLLSGYNLQTARLDWMIAGAVQGLGMGLYFVPLSTMSFSTLSFNQVPEAAGLFSFARNMGSSIGISLVSTIITRERQINWNRLVGHINTFNPNLHLWLQHHGWQLRQPVALGQLQQQLLQQSGMIAFLDAFWIVALALFLLLPLVYFMKWTGAVAANSSESSLETPSS